MSTPRDLAIPFERIAWRDGQLLASRDLRDDQRYGDRLRHLHIRYQHKTWGVVEGLEVAAVGTSGVAVNPGYALDIEGRELLLPVLARVATPADIAASTTMYLVISQSAGSTACAAPPDLATLCPGIRNPIPIEQGRLSWKTVTQVRPGTTFYWRASLIAGEFWRARLTPPCSAARPAWLSSEYGPMSRSRARQAGPMGSRVRSRTYMPRSIHRTLDSS